MNILFMSYLRTEWVSLRFYTDMIDHFAPNHHGTLNNMWFNICIICILNFVLQLGLFWHHEFLLELSCSSIWIKRMDIRFTEEHFHGFQHLSIIWRNSFKKPKQLFQNCFFIYIECICEVFVLPVATHKFTQQTIQNSKIFVWYLKQQ